MQETQVQSLGQEYLLEKDMTSHSSIFAGKIPWRGLKKKKKITTFQEICTYKASSILP